MRDNGFEHVNKTVALHTLSACLYTHVTRLVECTVIRAVDIEQLFSEPFIKMLKNYTYLTLFKQLSQAQLLFRLVIKTEISVYKSCRWIYSLVVYREIA